MQAEKAGGAAGVGAAAGDSAAEWTVPLVPISRRAFAVRRETAVLFELMKVDASDVLFAEDIPLMGVAASGSSGGVCDGSAPPPLDPTALGPPCLRLVLTDHNELCEGMRGWGASVEEILDHHRDARAHAHVAGRARQIDYDEAAGRGVGSACTLVAREYAARMPHLLDATVAGLLMGASREDAAARRTARAWGRSLYTL